METALDLQVALGEVETYDDFCEVRSKFSGPGFENSFQSLWPLAIQRGNSAEMAGYMLIELQPDTDHGIESLLEQIHCSELDASNRSVPFYLVSQFGRGVVMRAASSFVTALPSEAPRSKVDAVLYWSSFPASELCKSFHDWEARDTYGIADP